jgi:hypothetical protein
VGFVFGLLQGPFFLEGGDEAAALTHFPLTDPRFTPILRVMGLMMLQPI